MLNISNTLGRVSARLGKSCQLQVFAENHFKRYFSNPRSRPSTEAGLPVDLLERPSTRPRPNHSNNFRNGDGFMNKTMKVKIKDCSNFSGDPEVFGNLAGPVHVSTATFDRKDFDEGDRRETQHLETNVDRAYKLSTKQYADLIKEHIKNRNLKGAIEVLQEKMLKEDKVKPENYIYNLLIGACGRMGQAKQAFHLYNQMKKRNLKPTGGTYTALFNACATTVYPEDGLKRANHLREIMLEKGYQPNESNYHAMIKAYGRCGDLTTAFTLVDDMIEKSYIPTHETFNFLLQACISDREVGFRHALLVWRKMRDYNIKPTVYTYNLLLRTVRDCGLGDQQVATDVLRKISNCETLFMLEGRSESGSTGSSLESEVDEGSLESERGNTPSIERKSRFESEKSIGSQASNEGNHKQVYHEIKFEETALKGLESEKADEVAVEMKRSTHNKEVLTVQPENWPNLLGIKPHLGDIVSISEFVTPQDRLLLLGGCSSFLSQMSQDNAEPNIKTYTQMLDVIPGTIAAEKALMSTMKRRGVHFDIDWYNMLIKKRSMRFDYLGAQQVLTLVSKARLVPDVLTFGVLALGCKTEEQAVKLLHDMEEAGFSINVEIVGAMLKQACLRWNFGYVLEMMETLKRHNVAPNKQFYEHLHTFHTNGRQMIYDKERGRKGSEFVNEDYFRKGFKLFCARYKNWLKETQEEVPPSRLSPTSDDKWISRRQAMADER